MLTFWIKLYNLLFFSAKICNSQLQFNTIDIDEVNSVYMQSALECSGNIKKFGDWTHPDEGASSSSLKNE